MLTLEKKMARIERAKQHAAADRLRSGYYSDDADHSRGCSVGCDAIDIAGWQSQFDNPHAIVAEHDGTPEWLEYLRDAVFENLPKEDRARWHVELAEALPVGVDMQPAYHAICAAMLQQTLEHRPTWDDSYGVQVEAAIRQVIAYHSDPTDIARNAARNAGRSAARNAQGAAWSAARNAASNAAWSAAWSAARSAGNAGDAAGNAAGCAARSAADTVESAAWRRIAATVIGILSAQAQ